MREMHGGLNKQPEDQKIGGSELAPASGLMRLAPPVDRAIRRTGAEVSCLLQAVEVVQDRLGHGCPVRSGYVLNEYNFSGLVLRNTPEPGVRNDGSNHPGESLAPI